MVTTFGKYINDLREISKISEKRVSEEGFKKLHEKSKKLLGEYQSWMNTYKEIFNNQIKILRSFFDIISRAEAFFIKEGYNFEPKIFESIKEEFYMLRTITERWTKALMRLTSHTFGLSQEALEIQNKINNSYNSLIVKFFAKEREVALAGTPFHTDIVNLKEYTSSLSIDIQNYLSINKKCFEDIDKHLKELETLVKHNREMLNKEHKLTEKNELIFKQLEVFVANIRKEKEYIKNLISYAIRVFAGYKNVKKI